MHVILRLRDKIILQCIAIQNYYQYHDIHLLTIHDSCDPMLIFWWL